jgi:hypothetical protein
MVSGKQYMLESPRRLWNLLVCWPVIQQRRGAVRELALPASLGESTEKRAQVTCDRTFIRLRLEPRRFLMRQMARCEETAEAPTFHIAVR